MPKKRADDEAAGTSQPPADDRADDRADDHADEGVDADFVEERRGLAEFDFGELHDWARRVGVAARKRRAVVEKLATASGTSLTEIDALHEADWALVQRQAQEREASANALLAHHHARQRAALKTVAAHRERFEYQGGNPVFQSCLWRAAAPVTIALLPFTFNQGAAGLAPPAPVSPPPTVGNNLVRFTASAQANASGTPSQLVPVAGFELLTSHAFQTTARADGILSVSAHFAPLGTIFLGAPGDCVGFGGSAGATLTVLMDVRITTPTGRRIDIPRGDVREIMTERVHAGCDAETRLLLVGPTGGDAYSLTNADLASVEEGDTVRVTARYVLRLSTALRGSAVATFATAPSGLNVPLVVAKIVT